MTKYRSRRERKASKIVDAGFPDEKIKGHENSIEPDVLKKGGRIRKRAHGGHVDGKHAKHHMAKRARGGHASGGDTGRPRVGYPGDNDPHGPKTPRSGTYPEGGNDADMGRLDPGPGRMPYYREGETQETKRGGGIRRASGGSADDKPYRPLPGAMTPDEFDAHLKSLDWSPQALRGKRIPIQKPAEEDDRKRGGGIHIKPSHRGLLHKQMGVAQGKPISTKALEHAKEGASPAEKKRIVFAENARKWRHG